MPLVFASTVADIGGLIAAVATLGLLAAAIAGGVIASNQLDGLKQQLQLQRQSERRRRVHELLEHLFDVDFIKMSLEAEDLFKHRPAHALGWKALWDAKTPEQKSMITAIMNFYEVVASEYNDPTGDLVDKALADKALTSIGDAMWLQAESFVYWLRTLADPGTDEAYAEWEQMHKTFTASSGT